MPPSSTSSSRTYAGLLTGLREHPPWALLAALLVLLVIEVTIGRADWIWSYYPRSESGVVDAIEDNVIAPSDDPRVLFLGSSRTRDGIAPRLVEAELGLREGEVLNLGLTGGAHFDALFLYERNREALQDADVALLGVENFMLNPHVTVPERVNRFASLSQRIRWFDGDDRMSLVAGWFWRTYDAREALRRDIEQTWAGTERKPVRMSDDGRIVWIKRRKISKKSSQREVRKLWKEWEISAGKVRAMHDLIDALQADGIEVILFQMPTREDFWTRTRKQYPDKVDAYYATMRAVAEAQGVPYYEWETVQEFGMQDDDLFDYGHMTDRGAKKFAGVLADTLWEHHRDALPDHARR